MVDIFSTHVEIWNTETCQRHFKKGEGKRKNNGGDESNLSMLHAYMEMSQQNSHTTIMY
jgi:hypothetical protein